MADRTLPRRLAERYVIHEEIASGGMATVYFGQLEGPAGFKKDVAIKQLHPHVGKEPGFASMLLDEARLAARIHHVNVVPTLEVVTSDDELYLVMEYVNGAPLSKVLRSTPRVPVPVAVAVMVGVLRGLHAAHDALDDAGEPLGIVHRDVSPHNIVIGVDGVSRILDFGIAKAVGRLQTTSDGQVKGKASYMAPEQIRGERVDRRADVFSASVVLWETLTGQRLFQGANPAESMARVLMGDVNPPSAVLAEVPAALDAIVLRGLAYAPGERFPSALEMAVALEDAVVPASAARVSSWLVEVLGEAVTARRVALRAGQPRVASESGDAGDMSTAGFSGVSSGVARSRRPAWQWPAFAALASVALGSTWMIANRAPGSVALPAPALAPTEVTAAPTRTPSVASPAPAAPPASDPLPATAREAVAVPRPTLRPALRHAAVVRGETAADPAPSVASTAAATPACHYEKVLHDGGIIVPVRVCK